MATELDLEYQIIKRISDDSSQRNFEHHDVLFAQAATSEQAQNALKLLKEIENSHLLPLVESNAQCKGVLEKCVLFDIPKQQFQTLAAWLSGHGVIDEYFEFKPISIRNLMRQCIYALNGLHCKGLVHRNIQPSSILTFQDQDQRVFILAGLQNVCSVRDKEVLNFHLPSTISSPEQLEGLGASIKSDIFQLGVTFFNVFTSTPVSDILSMIQTPKLKERLDQSLMPLSLPVSFRKSLVTLLYHMVLPDPSERWDLDGISEYIQDHMEPVIPVRLIGAGLEHSILPLPPSTKHPWAHITVRDLRKECSRSFDLDGRDLVFLNPAAIQFDNAMEKTMHPGTVQIVDLNGDPIQTTDVERAMDLLQNDNIINTTELLFIFDRSDSQETKFQYIGNVYEKARRHLQIMEDMATGSRSAFALASFLSRRVKHSAYFTEEDKERLGTVVLNYKGKQFKIDNASVQNEIEEAEKVRTQLKLKFEQLEAQDSLIRLKEDADALAFPPGCLEIYKIGLEQLRNIILLDEAHANLLLEDILAEHGAFFALLNKNIEDFVGICIALEKAEYLLNKLRVLADLPSGKQRDFLMIILGKLKVLKEVAGHSEVYAFEGANRVKAVQDLEATAIMKQVQTKPEQGKTIAPDLNTDDIDPNLDTILQVQNQVLSLEKNINETNVEILNLMEKRQNLQSELKAISPGHELCENDLKLPNHRVNFSDAAETKSVLTKLKSSLVASHSHLAKKSDQVNQLKQKVKKTANRNETLKAHLSSLRQLASRIQDPTLEKSLTNELNLIEEELDN